jgi:hypothetical protein
MSHFLAEQTGYDAALRVLFPTPTPTPIDIDIDIDIEAAYPTTNSAPCAH